VVVAITGVSVDIVVGFASSAVDRYWAVLILAIIAGVVAGVIARVGIIIAMTADAGEEGGRR